MNTYRHTFTAVCPADNETILYQLEIRSLLMIHVEHIKTATVLIKKGCHEQIADRLAESLGGDQTIIATHQGIEIETVRLSRLHTMARQSAAPARTAPGFLPAGMPWCRFHARTTWASLLMSASRSSSTMGVFSLEERRQAGC